MKRQKTEDKYPCLDKDIESRSMSDKEILEKIYGFMSCLSEAEKKEVIEMLYIYNGAFILRNETGTCPNIAVEIDVTD